MFRDKESIFVTIICAAGMGMFVALWLLDFAVVRIDACEASESRGLCLRGWISALSGWAAAIGALIAAGLTIAKLREQIADQKRQTDFIIGDSFPIIEWAQNQDHFSIRIKNYNRHRVQLIEIENKSAYAIGLWLYVCDPQNSFQALPHKQSIGLNEKLDVRQIMSPIIMGGYEGNGTTIPVIDIRMDPVGTAHIKQARNDFACQFTVQVQDNAQTKHSLIIKGSGKSM